MIPRPGLNRGMTLIELLIAIAIFAIVSMMAYGGLMQVLNTRDRVESERVFWRALSYTFHKLDEDLSQARLRQVRDVDGMPLPSFTGAPVDSRALGAPSLEFTRGGLPIFGNAPRSDLQRVGYRLNEGKFYRLVWSALDRAPLAKPIETVLLSDVEELKVRMFDSASKQWVGDWPMRNPAGTHRDDLPRAVEITLRFKSRGDFVRTFLVGPP